MKEILDCFTSATTKGIENEYIDKLGNKINEFEGKLNKYILIMYHGILNLVKNLNVLLNVLLHVMINLINIKEA